MTDKILTLHPEPGKTGRRLDKDLYETIKTGLIDVLKSAGGQVTHTELFERLEKQLKGKVKGSISWYGETVKLDLEARQIIKRLPGSPQKIQLVAK